MSDTASSTYLEGLKNQAANARAEVEQLRAQRDQLQAWANQQLDHRRMCAEIGGAVISKWPDLKARGRKLLEESAEVMVEVSDAWRLKQHGTERLRAEIGDVLIVLFSICVAMGIDPWEAVRQKWPSVKEKYGL